MLTSIEDSLKSYQESLKGLFFRKETHESACNYLRGLLSKVERKNSWQLSESLGKTTPYQLQRLISQSAWNADDCRDFVKKHVIKNLGSSGTCVFDDTGFLKKGKKSAGVQRQYTGTAGRIENCQIGVFAAWKTSCGHGLIDRELYVPQSWFDEPQRCKDAGIDETTKFKTKQQLAQSMYDRLLESGHKPLWVTADEAYGRDQNFRKHLEHQNQAYVLSVPKDHRVRIGLKKLPVEKFFQKVSIESWQRISCGDGTKGARLSDWSILKTSAKIKHGLAHYILCRRNIKDITDLSYYHVYAFENISLHKIVNVAGERRVIEECFEAAKNETGLDQYEVRSATGWYRHITLAMTAFAFLVTERAKALSSSTEYPLNNLHSIEPLCVGSLAEFKKTVSSNSIFYPRN